MAERSFCYLVLTCKDDAEASKIARQLLAEKLIVCAKRLPVASDFLWKGEVESGNEVMLVMESREDLFDAVETVVAKLHSYETFVLEMLPVKGVNQAAANWMQDNLTPQQ